MRGCEGAAWEQSSLVLNREYYLQWKVEWAETFALCTRTVYQK